MQLIDNKAMGKKTVYLFVALILPISIFVFLKLMGKNQFAIPTYYSSGIDSLSSICEADYSKPYFVPDSILEKINWKEKECSLFLLGKTNNLELKRLRDVFTTEQFDIYSINAESKQNGHQLTESVFAKWKNCIFIAKPFINVVLIDNEKKIRGYYSIGSREEMDRLLVEMKILLKQY
jgi:hypothetical protein